MSELPDSLRCLFSARLDRRGDSYVLEVPAQEVDTGNLELGEVLSVAVHSGPDGAEPVDADARSGRQPEGPQSAQQPGPGETGQPGQADQPDRTDPSPEVPNLPVEEGEHRVVTIESLDEQDDGVAKIEGGYVIIVPETDPGDEVEVEITMVTPTVAFAEVVEER